MIAILTWLEGLTVLERALVESMAASTLFLGVAWLAALGLRRRSAALRAHFWLTGFLAIAAFGLVRVVGITVKLPIAPVPSEIGAKSSISQREISQPYRLDTSVKLIPSLDMTQPPSQTQTQSAEQGHSELPKTLYFLAIVWAGGVCVLLFKATIGLIVLMVSIRSASKPHPNGRLAGVLIQMPEIAQRKCDVRLHPGAFSPVCFGFRKAWVMLPPEAEQWEECRLRFVLQHELIPSMPGVVVACSWRSSRSVQSPHDQLSNALKQEIRSSASVFTPSSSAFGLLDGLGQVADIANDSVGQALSSAELPKRIHLKRSSVRSKMSDFEVNWPRCTPTTHRR